MNPFRCISLVSSQLEQTSNSFSLSLNIFITRRNGFVGAVGLLPLLLLVTSGCTPSQTSSGSGTSNSGASGITSSILPSNIKLGFIVKQPEEPWFQNEWDFAQKAADKDKFALVKIGAQDGDKALSAIDNLAAQGAQGFVICTPDVRLGPALLAKAQAANLKMFTVDDRLIGADSKPLAVPYMGISATEIGKGMGQAVINEMKKRKWKTDEVGVCAMTFEELDTARQRTDGAIAAITASGFPSNKIFKAAQKTSDVPGAIDTANILLTQHGDIKKWLIVGMNDEAVLGAVRATEGRSFTADDVIGVGIGGTTGVVDFKKDKPTGFFGTMLISPRRHGYETTEMLYRWVKDGKEPSPATFTSGTLITRANYKEKMKAEGLSS